jgi:starch synthase
LTGIVNGIDTDHWNPQADTNISACYDASTLHKKKLNKTAMQIKYNLPVDNKIPVFVLISRLVEQKGIDILLECLPEMLTLPLQFLLLGKGDKLLEQQLSQFAKIHSEKMVINLGYDEAIAHQLEAGADIFLMPSRFEPCGLNQLYSQRYGTVPIVTRTGGLADTVVDTLPETIKNKTATGFVFKAPTTGSLMEAIKRALIVYEDSKNWKQLQINGMKKDYSWNRSAKEYLALYEQL